MDNTLVKIESPQIQTSLTQTGWDLPTKMTENDWKEAGSFLMQVNQARQWWLGDWWNACKWGDGKAACGEVGVDYGTAKNCGSVSAKFELSRRHDKLTFAHHVEVCPIEDPTTQDQLLDWCLSGTSRKSVRDLREKVQEYLEKKDWEDFDTEMILDGNIQASKELVQARKELEESKVKCAALEDSPIKEIKSNLDNLIPEIKELLDDKLIMPAMALNISTMDPKGQQAWLSMHVRKNSLENQLREKTARVKELEDMPKPEAKIVEKEVIPLDVQEKLEKAEGSLAKLRAAERSAKNIRSDFNKISSDKHALEKEISILKDQLKINDPENVDIALASDLQEIQELLKSKIIRIKEQQAKHDHTMPIALAVIEDTISMLSAFSDSVNEIDAIEV